MSRKASYCHAECGDYCQKRDDGGVCGHACRKRAMHEGCCDCFGYHWLEQPDPENNVFVFEDRLRAPNGPQKIQLPTHVHGSSRDLAIFTDASVDVVSAVGVSAVSYTHLTLPTKA